jgi:ABC-type antimicrobial peptide transport system ATPase subunit
MAACFHDAGLVDARMTLVAPGDDEAGKLTVAIWLARDPRVIADDPRNSLREFA